MASNARATPPAARKRAPPVECGSLLVLSGVEGLPPFAAWACPRVLLALATCAIRPSAERHAAEPRAAAAPHHANHLYVSRKRQSPNPRRCLRRGTIHRARRRYLA